MRIPDPKANTTTEAYLAYKAGYLEESELKPVLYEPYLHFDAWLAYWAGLTETYPVKNVGKNLLNPQINHKAGWEDTVQGITFTLQNDGGVYMKGTSTGTQGHGAIAELVGSSGWYGTDIAIPLDPSKTYQISATRPDNTYRFFVRGIKNGAVTTIASNNNNTVTGCSGVTLVQVEVSNGVAVDGAIYLQIELGSTATSYEPYTGEPEMLCDEEALVAYLSGVTDTYPEDIKDPYDVRIVGYLKYLVSARYGRPEYPVNNEEFYLSTMTAPIIPSGDPSSSIEIDGTAKAPFALLEAYGDTTQQTYSGVQLLKKDGMATPSTDTTYWSSFSTNLTQTPKNNGWSTMTRTVTSGYSNFQTSTSSVDIVAGSTYTAIVEIENCTITSGSIVFVQTNATQDPVESYTIVAGCNNVYDTSMGASLTGSTTPKYNVYVFNTKSGFTRGLRYYIGQYSGSGSFDVRATVLAGDHSSDWQNYCGDNWQPFVGGIPSPNPDYPQDINVVTGKQTVDVWGKNLFNYRKYTTAFLRGNGGAVSVSNPSGNILRASNKVAQSNNFVGMAINDADSLLGKTVTASADVIAMNGVEVTRLALYWVTNSGLGSQIGSPLSIESTGNYVLTVDIPNSFPSNATGIALVIYGNGSKTGAIYGGDGTYVDWANIQFEFGSTATSYEAHQSYEVNLGKNLFDKDNMNVRNAYLYNNQLVIRQNYSDRSFFIQCEPSTTYTISRGKITSSFRVAYSSTSVADIPSTTSEIQRVACGGEIDNDTGSSITITTDSTAKTIIVHYGTTSDSNLEESVASIQIEKGSTATSYAPYFTPIELCKIGEYQDYIYKNGDDWYLHRETTKIELAAVTTWGGNSGSFFKTG